MSVKVDLIHPFDAFAGSQRVTAHIARALAHGGFRPVVHIGFGGRGFLSEWTRTRRFLAVEAKTARKLLYPIWVAYMNLFAAAQVLRGHVVWGQTITAAPAIVLAALLRHEQVIVHLHEIPGPKSPLRLALALVQALGARLLCVSHFHRSRLGLDCEVLYNCVWPERSVSGQRPDKRDTLVFVGTTNPKKGFSLYTEVVRELQMSRLRPVAFLSDSQANIDALLLERARDAGIEVRFGVQRTAEMFERGFLTLLLTDPLLWEETFSLVSVESLTHGVPVASAGSEVLKEVCGSALAFDEPSRDPRAIARAINDLLGTGSERYRELVNACDRVAASYAPPAFSAAVTAIVAGAGRGRSRAPRHRPHLGRRRT